MSKELVVLESYGLIPRIPEAFDHQVTGTFQECHRMAYYKHILGRERTHSDKTALNWGKVFHSCTEIWDTTGQNPDAVKAFIDESLSENIEDRYGRTQGRMFEAFTTWAMWRAVNPLKILRTEQPVLVTCSDGASCPYFEEGCGLTYGGRIDRVVEWDGMIGPLDFKTTVMDETDPISEYRPNHQFMGYVWAVSHLMAAHSWGIIVERLVTNKSKIKIDRYPVSFSKDNIREWVETEKVVQQEIHTLFGTHPNNEIAWTQNYFRCFKPWPCEFRDACLSPRDMGFRYRWLRDNTVERRWDFRNPDAKGDAQIEPVVGSIHIVP